MKQWYCRVGGAQYGPVSETELRQWIAEGRLGPDDTVWAEGMDAWTPIGQVPYLSGAGAAGPAAPTGTLVAWPSPGGTSGATPNATLTSQARDLLQGRWGLPIGFCVLLSLIQGAVGQMVPFGILIIAGPFELGSAIFFLTFVRGGPGEIAMMFGGFKDFGRALGAYLLRALLVGLWMVPAILAFVAMIIVGIALSENQSEFPIVLIPFVILLVPLWIGGMIGSWIATLAYSQTLFLLADEPDLGIKDSLRKSKEMMAGRKGKLFCLHMRFLGWALLVYVGGILTCGIGLIVGFLFLMPYIAVSLARFYDDLRGPAGQVALSPVEQQPLPEAQRTPA